MSLHDCIFAAREHTSGFESSSRRGATRIRALVVHQNVSETAFITSKLEKDPRVDVVATAQDGVVGMRAAIAHHPDLIVMDVQAALLSGVHTAGFKRALPESKVLVVCAGEHDVAYAVSRCNADAFFVTDRLGEQCEAELSRLFPA